jgi:predicted lipid-binding transport protein (Tim44 family)
VNLQALVSTGVEGAAKRLSAPGASPPAFTPAEALTAAVEALVDAAGAYAASDVVDTGAFMAGDYRVRFQGEQLLRVERV